MAFDFFDDSDDDETSNTSPPSPRRGRGLPIPEVPLTSPEPVVPDNNDFFQSVEESIVNVADDDDFDFFGSTPSSEQITEDDIEVEDGEDTVDFFASLREDEELAVNNDIYEQLDDSDSLASDDVEEDDEEDPLEKILRETMAEVEAEDGRSLSVSIDDDFDPYSFDDEVEEDSDEDAVISQTEVDLDDDDYWSVEETEHSSEPGRDFFSPEDEDAQWSEGEAEEEGGDLAFEPEEREALFDEEISFDAFSTPLTKKSAADTDTEEASDDQTEANESNKGFSLSSLFSKKSDKGDKRGSVKDWFNGLFIRIKDDFKGEDDTNAPKAASPMEEIAQGPKSEATKTQKEGSLWKKIAFPYVWLMQKILGLLNSLIGILAKLPVVGAKIALLSGSSALSFIAAILPVVFTLSFLTWHSGQEIDFKKSIDFPDGGSLVIRDISYDKEKEMVAVVIENNGEVVADVTPSAVVYSTKLSINPLTLFYPKNKVSCEGELMSIPIAQTAISYIPCSIDGRAKKFTGEIEWTE